MGSSPNLPICPRTFIGLKRWNKLSGGILCIDWFPGWFGFVLVSHSHNYTAEKIKSYTGHRDSHGDISNHRTEAGNKSQLDSFVNTGYFSLLYHRIKKCPSTRQIQCPKTKNWLWTHSYSIYIFSSYSVPGSVVHLLPKSWPAMKTYWNLVLAPVMLSGPLGDGCKHK